MEIRKAEEKDVKGIMRLLRQVNDVHADLRPDIFVKGHTKYDEVSLTGIINDTRTPVFVAVDEAAKIAGYCFCIVEDHSGYSNLHPVKTLYIDDLCVDENARGCHIGRNIFEYVKTYAAENGFYNVTLNVWNGNESARKFYEAMGMTVMKTTMEIII